MTFTPLTQRFDQLETSYQKLYDEMTEMSFKPKELNCKSSLFDSPYYYRFFRGFYDVLREKEEFCIGIQR